MTDLTAVSLFAGVGGIDLALERAGVHVTAAVEINAAARGVIAQQRPDIALFNDVTKVTPDELRATGFVPERGILAGGFPCQDLSVAGRRAGLGGARSGLFWHIMRLADALRPQWLLLENVPGLLSSVCACPGDESCKVNGRNDGDCGEWRTVKGQRSWHARVVHGVAGGACRGGCVETHGGAMGAVTGALGERGYGFAYRVLDAQFFGVPQRRERVFIVGCLGDAGRPVQVLLEPEGRGRNPAPGHPAGSRVAATLTSGASGVGVSAPGRRQEDDVNLVVSPTVTSKWAKGTGGPAGDEAQNLVVSTLQGGGVEDTGSTPNQQPAGTSSSHREVVMALTSNGVGTCGADDNQAQAGHLVTHTHTFQKVTRPATSDHPDVWAERDVAATLSPHDLGSETRAVELVVQPLAIRGREHGAELEIGPEGGPYNALRAGDAGSSRQSLIPYTISSAESTETKSHARATEVARSLDTTGGFAANQGGTVVATGCVTGDRTHALTSEGADASEDGSGRGTPIIGFHFGSYPGSEDDMATTLTARNGAPGAALTGTTVRRLTPVECERLQGFPDDWTALSNGKTQADSARYRQMGNAVAVPVVEWIARRIVEVSE